MPRMAGRQGRSRRRSAAPGYGADFAARAYALRYDWDFGERVDTERRMGLHDLSERYGRYSGGPEDAYEYSERTVEHRYSGRGAPVGFTRPLRPKRRARAPESRAPRGRARVLRGGRSPARGRPRRSPERGDWYGWRDGW